MQGCRLFRFSPCTTATAPLVSSVPDQSGEEGNMEKIDTSMVFDFAQAVPMFFCDVSVHSSSTIICHLSVNFWSNQTFLRGPGENRVAKHTEQKSWRVHKKKVSSAFQSPGPLFFSDIFVSGQLSCLTCNATSRYFLWSESRLFHNKYCIQVSLHLPWDLTWYPTPLSSQRRRSSPSPSRGRRGRPWSAGNSTPWRRRSKRTPLSSSSRTLPHRSLLTVASWSSQPPHHQL